MLLFTSHSNWGINNSWSNWPTAANKKSVGNFPSLLVENFLPFEKFEVSVLDGWSKAYNPFLAAVRMRLRMRHRDSSPQQLMSCLAPIHSQGEPLCV
jgi:hypothetical protein